MHAVTEETKQKLIDLFEAGYSASGAYHKHRQNIRTQYPNDWVRILANRAFSPNYPYAFRLNNQWLLKKFGRIDGPDSIMRAMQHAAAYNEQNPVDEPGKQSCFVHQREDGHYIIGIVNFKVFSDRVNSCLSLLSYRVSNCLSFSSYVAS